MAIRPTNIFGGGGAIASATARVLADDTVVRGTVPAGATATCKKNGTVLGAATVTAQGAASYTLGAAGPLVAGDQVSFPWTLTGETPIATTPRGMLTGNVLRGARAGTELLALPISGNVTAASISPNDGRVLLRADGRTLIKGLTDSSPGNVDYTVTYTDGSTSVARVVCANATLRPVVGGFGGPGKTLTVQTDAVFSDGSAVATRQWVSGPENGSDPTTFTNVVATGSSFTQPMSGPLVGQRICQRQISTNNEVSTSVGVVCTKVPFGFFGGNGDVTGTSPEQAQAFADLMGGRPLDYVVDGMDDAYWNKAGTPLSSYTINNWANKLKANNPNLGISLLIKIPKENAAMAGIFWTEQEMRAGKQFAFAMSSTVAPVYNTVFDNTFNGDQFTIYEFRIGHENNLGYPAWKCFVGTFCFSSAPITGATTTTGNITINGTTVSIPSGSSLTTVVTTLSNALKAANSPVTAENFVDPSNGSATNYLNITAGSGVDVVISGDSQLLTDLKLTAGTYHRQAQGYKDWWRYIVGLIEAKRIAAGISSSRVHYTYNPNKGYQNCPFDVAYPGDDIVTRCTMDNYLDLFNPNGYPSPANAHPYRYSSDAEIFDSNFVGYGPKSPGGYKANYQSYAHKYLEDWCLDHNKAIGVCEFGGPGYRLDGSNFASVGNRTGFVRGILARLDAWTATPLGWSTFWGDYRADLQTRVFQSSNIPLSHRQVANRWISQTYAKINMTLTKEGQTAAEAGGYMDDELPNAAAEFVGYMGSEAAQLALLTPRTIANPVISFTQDAAGSAGDYVTFIVDSVPRTSRIVQLVFDTSTGGALGTGTAGTDFTAMTGNRYYAQPHEWPLRIKVAVPAGATLGKTFTLNMTKPTAVEDSSVASNVAGFAPYLATYSLGAKATATGTITPPVSIPDMSVSESVVGGVAQIAVSIPSAWPCPFSVTATTDVQHINSNYTITAATAMAGADYTAASAVLTFQPGETVKYLPVPINDDIISEGDEFFFVNLSGLTTGTLGKSYATITIPQNDIVYGTFDANAKSSTTLSLSTDLLTVTKAAGSNSDSFVRTTVQSGAKTAVRVKVVAGAKVGVGLLGTGQAVAATPYIGSNDYSIGVTATSGVINYFGGTSGTGIGAVPVGDYIWMYFDKANRNVYFRREGADGTLYDWNAATVAANQNTAATAAPTTGGTSLGSNTKLDTSYVVGIASVANGSITLEANPPAGKMPAGATGLF